MLGFASTMTALRGLLGESEGIVALRREVSRLLPQLRPGHRTPAILLLGETGTGKGLLARLLHRESSRAHGSFVEVNCAAIPETLLEAELFGFERGAFTDARFAKPGLAQAAHGGTLFLDEVGLLPETLQAKLLTLLEERTVRRLGGTRSEPVDALIVAASNGDLGGDVARGRFRQDLYHRLAGLTFTLPPLRERGGDTLTLARVFLARSCADHGLAPKTLSDAAAAALLAHPWPGNVRELANLMERTALLREEAIITAAHLNLPPPPAVGPVAQGTEAGPRATPLRASLERLRRAHVLEALRTAGDNVSRAAEQLGIPRSTLRYHLERLGLGPRATPRQRPPLAAEPRSDVTSPLPSATGPGPVRWEVRQLALLLVMIEPRSSSGSAFATAPSLELLADKAQSFGGRVEQLTAAGLLLVFGLETLEDAAARAAYAAMAMRRALEPGREGEAVAGIRLALHVERLPVASANGSLRIDLDAKREALGVLETMVRQVDPGTVVLSEAMAPFLSRRYHLESLGLDLGRHGPAYRALGPERAVFPPAAMAPFVGRERELAILRDLLVRARERAQMVSIVGEAGIGKSRLLHELRESIGGSPITYLEGRCAPYAVHVPYFPIRALLRQLCRLGDRDPEAVVAERLATITAELTMQPADHHLLLPLLGMGEPAEMDATSLLVSQSRTFDALRRLVLSIARTRTAVLAIDDVHWIDRTSEAWLLSLMKGLAGAPLLIALTHRNDYRPGWLEKSPVTQMRLAPLGHRESQTLVQWTLHAATISDSLGDAILARAAGNPFFLEELARDARDVTRSDRSVPATVQQVIQARMDRLPAAGRTLLQTAAVLGPAFPAALLASVAGVDSAEVEARLNELASLEFLREPSSTEPTGWTFTHSLVQDVAYESLPAAERQGLHLAAGAALERLAPGGSETGERLAFHFSRSGDAERAVHHLTRFAEQAARRYARAEALVALHEALAHVERLAAGPEQDRLFRELLRRQREALYFLGDLRRSTLDFLLRQRPRVEQAQDPALASLYYLWLGRIATPLGDFELAAEAAERAVSEARRTGDEMTVASAQSVLSHAYCWLGRATEGLQHGREAASRLEGTSEIYWLGYAWRSVAMNCLQVGDFAATLDAASRAGAAGEAIGESFFVFTAAWLPAIVSTVTEGPRAAITACRRLLEQSPSAFEMAQSAMFLGLAYLEAGDGPEAAAWLSPLVAEPERLRQRHVRALCMAYLAEAQLLMGSLDQAAALAQQALEETTATRYRHAVGYAWRAVGLVAAARGDYRGAERALTEAIDTWKSVPARFELARTHMVLAEVAEAMGSGDAAKRYRSEGEANFIAIGLPPYRGIERMALHRSG